MKIWSALAALTFFVGFGGCATVGVQTDFNAKADFGRYQTFDWFPQPAGDGHGGLPQNPSVRDQIREIAQRELSAKGLRYTPGGSADFFIAPRLTGKEKTDEASWGYGLGYWGHGAASGG